MIGFQSEPGLQKSWLTGDVYSVTLSNPVFDARMVCAGDEPKARALRDILESVFEKWRDENGTFPEATGGLFGGFNIHEGKTLAECPPYACMGERWADYADLLAKLRAEEYPPLLELEAAANYRHPQNPASPNDIPRLPETVTKSGMQRILAALILSEAAAGNIDSATKAHWELSRIQDENQRREDEGIRAGDKVLYRFTVAGIKSHQGYKSRDEFQDKLDCQAIAKTMWDENPSLTIAALTGAAKIAPYAKKYKGKNTLRDWLSEIDPRPPEKKRGRPKTKN